MLLENQTPDAFGPASGFPGEKRAEKERQSAEVSAVSSRLGSMRESGGGTIGRIGMIPKVHGCDKVIP